MDSSLMNRKLPSADNSLNVLPEDSKTGVSSMFINVGEGFTPLDFLLKRIIRLVDHKQLTTVAIDNALTTLLHEESMKKETESE